MKAINYFLLFLLVPILGKKAQGQHKLINFRIECPQQLVLGDTLRLVVFLDVEDGYHIYAPGYFGDTGGFPTDLEFTAPLVMGLKQLGTAKMLDANGEAFGSIAKGKDIRLVQLFKYEKGLPDKAITISGDFRYQICDNQSCYVPELIPFEYKVNILNVAKKQGSIKKTTKKRQ